MRLDPDHVVVGGTDLDALADRFERLGLPTEYGGEHADGTTHMRVLAFEDGSYLECIAPTPATAPADAGYWPDRLAADAGPAAWAVRTDDARATAREAIGAGFAVAGPTAGGRDRPDGTRVEWEAVVLGTPEGPVGEGEDLAFPFAVRDRTPRAYRVPPAWTHEGPATGVGTAVVAVPELEPWVDRFARLAGLPTPRRTESPALSATVAAFPGEPLALAAPAGDGSPLADRLDALGPGPCAYLLSVPSLDAAADAYPLGERAAWPTGAVAWFEGERGVLGVAAPER